MTIAPDTMHAQMVSAYSTVFALAIGDAVALAHAVLLGEDRGVRRDAAGQVAVRDCLVAEHEVRRVTVLLGRADHDVAHVVWTLGEDAQLLAEYLLLHQLERRARSAQHVA